MFVLLLQTRRTVYPIGRHDLRIVASSTPWRFAMSGTRFDRTRTPLATLNCSVYLLMENTPKVGSISNLWGAVQLCRSGFFSECDCREMCKRQRERHGPGAISAQYSNSSDFIGNDLLLH